MLEWLLFHGSFSVDIQCLTMELLTVFSSPVVDHGIIILQDAFVCSMEYALYETNS
jgi:hypothetical protein